MAEAAIAADRAHADPAIWITRRSDEAILADAAALEAEGPRGRPLWGVPFAVKDNIDVAGIPTTAACPGFAYTPDTDSPAVRRLLDAGALLIGKTNLDQFATGLVGTRSPYGVPRNVFDPALVPGGSSSGSACAVAAGIVRFALGTDTAGSGRVPAGFGNIVGLKPTIGSVSARGMVPACRSVDTISVLARSVDEALAVQRVIAVFDGDDAYARKAPFPHLRRSALPAGRVAMGDVAALCDADVAAAYADAAAFLTAAPVDMTLYLEVARLLYEGPWVSERTAALRSVVETTPDILYPATRTILELGLARLTVDAFDAFHLLQRARRQAAILFSQYDALLLPTAPFCPSLAEVEADPLGPNRRLGTFTNFANLCDMAGFAVPIGFGPNGTPIGGVLLGPAWSEGRLAPLADALHRKFATTVGATGQALPVSAEPDRVEAGETALFCIGAHMAGLPLNTQITALGGRFIREARTAPAYRLFALGNRPGMIRADDGAAIAGEVWALPTSSIGALLAQVPPPLGFGTVTLDDGPCLGFVAESAGVADAREITHLGGWRAWLRSGD
ncbi:MAG TPA: allophanate hydrolase [Acetobacteraceae bacterium]|nr:allophanate hydrolase [Acetobacteraceae bacterium]